MRTLLLFLTCAVLGAGLFAYSRTLPYYKDQARFDASYSALMDRYYGDDPDQSLANVNTESLTEAYYALQKKEMTLRWPLKDTGLALLIGGLGGALLFCRGIKGLKTPPNKWLLLPIGIIASVANLLGLYIFVKVDASPVWADGHLRGAAVAMVTGVWFMPLFVLSHGLFLMGRKFNVQATIFEIRMKYANMLLLAALGLWALMTVLIISATAWFFLIATPFWFYFYSSLLAIRAKGNELAKAA